MEFDHHSDGYWAHIDNEKRQEALPVITYAETVDELLQGTIQYFNEWSVNVTAEQLLSYFAHDPHPLVQNDQRFDSVLFKAVVLFEIPHIIGSDLDEMTQRLRRFWELADDVTEEEYPPLFGRFFKEPRASSLLAMDNFVRHMLVGQVTERQLAIIEAELEPVDPLELAIDGPRHVFIGFPERSGDSLLTRELRRDLGRLYPSSVIRELEYRLLPDMAEANILPLIERILDEREQNILPSPEEAAAGYRQQSAQIRSLFGIEWEDTRTDEETAKIALDNITRLRSKTARQLTWSSYYPQID